MEELLKNINIVLTRAKNQSDKSIQQLQRYGANVISFPTIEIAPIKNDPLLNQAISELENYDIIIFTSENAVKYFLDLVKDLNVHFEPTEFFIISIGEKTAQYCEGNKIQIDFQPKKYSWGFLLEELENQNLHGKKAFIPCSNLADINKYDKLKKLGVGVTAIPAYINKVNDIKKLSEEIKLIQNTKIDVYIFTSPSTFNGFLENLNISDPVQYFSGKNIAVIGPVTKRAINEYGVFPNIIPTDFTMEALIEEIKIFYKKNSKQETEEKN